MLMHRVMVELLISTWFLSHTLHSHDYSASLLLSHTHAYNNCSSSCTGEEDFHEIIALLQNEQEKFYKIGTWLRLPQSLLNTIRVQTPDYAEAMNRIINNWLIGNYDTEIHGPPTWKMLAEAVWAPNGGNNAALADEIARLHPATG